jgi:glucose/arabinose dehydrogenase
MALRLPLLATLLWLAGSAAPILAGSDHILMGPAAFGDWRTDEPGRRRLITPADLPPPGATPSVAHPPRVIHRPAGALPKVPPGFKVELFASGFSNPRLMRTAPNGDIFLAETQAGRIRVLRARDGAAKPDVVETYASGLSYPFGIAFYPPGPDPQWVYFANTDSIVRFAYRNGDLSARGRPQALVTDLPTGGHGTRDIVFSKDGGRMLVSVGSASNVAQQMTRKSVSDAVALDAARQALGAAWDDESGRAAVLSFTPEGKDRRVFATGIRNCVGLARQPGTGDIWCSTNERDGLGDNLVPDYVTRVREGAFYGWPWYYIGANEDPRHRGQRPDLAAKVTLPDVLIQPHSASLQMTFYDGLAFPESYRGDAFAAEHGSWNRRLRTGYKVIRVILKDGRPTGEYEDFMTGFVVDDSEVWGRPVGVTVARDGALLVSEDGNGTVWRVTYAGAAPSQSAK